MDTKNEFYIADNGKTIGPFTKDEILKKITQDSLVCKSDGKWTTAINLKEFEDYFKILKTEKSDLEDYTTNPDYYYSQNNEVFGPFKLNQLSDKISGETLICKDGINWIKACNVPELKSIFLKNTSAQKNKKIPFVELPLPEKNISKKDKEINKIPLKKNKNQSSIIITIFFGVSIIIFFILKNNFSFLSISNSKTNDVIDSTKILNIKSEHGLSDTWLVIIGSFKTNTMAQNGLNQFIDKGLNAELIKGSDFEKLNSRLFYVCIGKELSEEKAKELNLKIINSGHQAYIIDGGKKNN